MCPTDFIGKSIICLLSFLLLPLSFRSGPTFALDRQREVSAFGHTAWLTENGLPQNTVHSVIQTGDGYLWLATEEGLARFDGIKFTIFDKQNTPQLKSNDIHALFEDRRGAL
jgi:ligand-binding sensor domain-containing protein